MSNLQKVVDNKIEDLKIFSDKGLELGDRLSVLVTEEKKEDELNDDDLELLFDIKLLNNVITNKIISILELKYLSEEMSEDLNLDEFVKIPNVIEFETTYKNFKENQNFYIISEGTLKRNKNLTEEHFKNFKKEIEGAN